MMSVPVFKAKNQKKEHRGMIPVLSFLQMVTGDHPAKGTPYYFLTRTGEGGRAGL